VAFRPSGGHIFERRYADAARVRSRDLRPKARLHAGGLLVPNRRGSRHVGSAADPSGALPERRRRPVLGRDSCTPATSGVSSAAPTVAGLFAGPWKGT
jgi:hypothetical protein